MYVCKHGDVKRYCEANNMIIVDCHDGSIENYTGFCKVIVTDQEMSESEYYYLKGKMLAKGYELVSVWHQDTELAASLMTYYVKNETKPSGGRNKFGYRRVDGKLIEHEGEQKVLNRIFELKDKGYSVSEIRNDEGVRKMDGSMLSMSTIHLIVKNRKEYVRDEV